MVLRYTIYSKKKLYKKLKFKPTCHFNWCMNRSQCHTIYGFVLLCMDFFCNFWQFGWRFYNLCNIKIHFTRKQLNFQCKSFYLVSYRSIFLQPSLLTLIHNINNTKENQITIQFIFLNKSNVSIFILFFTPSWLICF